MLARSHVLLHHNMTIQIGVKLVDITINSGESRGARCPSSFTSFIVFHGIHVCGLANCKARAAGLGYLHCLVIGYVKAHEAGQWYLHCFVFR